MKKPPALIGSAVIDDKESIDFSNISGDFNPLHLDPVIARRYQFGSTLIHGINGTLRALDLFFATQEQSTSLSALRVSFSKPVQQGSMLDFYAEIISPTAAHIEIHSQGKKVQIIGVSFIPGILNTAGRERSSLTVGESVSTPANISIEHAKDLSSSVPMYWHLGLFAKLFPQLAQKIPGAQCATILATTQIVGMACPGLNSIYASLSLTFGTDYNSKPKRLDYRVNNVDQRFARVVMEVSNSIAAGEIEAFFRPVPVQQASYVQIKALVRAKQFSAQKALIVGGSRGLGEVVAKLLAAGGAYTHITYAKGRDDAMRVVSEISAAGGLCTATELDVLGKNGTEQLFDDEHQLTHIYYMASPVIEKNDSRLWDAGLFHKFTDFYIRGLADLIAPLTKMPEYRNAALDIYLPSTSFLNSPEKGFSEYIVAKAALESFAAQLQKKYPRWKLHTPRLPRMLTDQTSGITGLDPLENVRQILDSLPGACA